MRMMAKTMVALGFVGAMAVGTASPTLAQGVYFSGPGVEFGIGRPYYGDRYYRSYDGPYVYFGRSYNYDGPYAYSGRSYNSYSDRHQERRQLRRDWRWD